MRRLRGANAAPIVEVAVRSGLWRQEARIEAVIRRAIGAAAAQAVRRYSTAAELSVVLADDATIQKLNRGWRGQDKPTNVLSFPARPPNTSKTPKNGPIWLGDIVIAYETAAREATAQRKPLKNHVSHLAVHGFLHLLGYDHDCEGEAEEMEDLERAILATLGIPDPFAA
jgi:probable rRNA maturation factor